MSHVQFVTGIPLIIAKQYFLVKQLKWNWAIFHEAAEHNQNLYFLRKLAKVPPK